MSPRLFYYDRVLKSGDALSTDEESSGGESDDELETLLRGNKTSSQLTREQEEAERLELKKLIMGDKKEGGTSSERGGCGHSLFKDNTRNYINA